MDISHPSAATEPMGADVSAIINAITVANERTLTILRAEMAEMGRGLVERLEAVEARQQIASPRQVDIPPPSFSSWTSADREAAANEQEGLPLQPPQDFTTVPGQNSGQQNRGQERISRYWGPDPQMENLPGRPSVVTATIAECTARWKSFSVQSLY